MEDVSQFFEVDVDGATLLHLVIRYLDGRGQYEIIKCLLTHGADWSINDNAGKQCWEYLANADITKLLINHGAGLSATHNKSFSNVIHIWARSKDDRACEVLSYAIAKGADLYQITIMD